MAVSHRPEVYRVTGIKEGTSEFQLKGTLKRLLAAESENESRLLGALDSIPLDVTLCPSCTTGIDSQKKICIALFSFQPATISLDSKNHFNPWFLDKRVDKQVLPFDGGEGIGQIAIDRNFFGLTQIYPTRLNEDHNIIADIIAVTGLDGHAYGSWRGRHSDRMWLRHFFEEDFPECRTMLYGYNSKLGHHGTHTINDYALGLLEEIRKIRKTQQERRRPLIFIGHSLGGIVVTQSLITASQVPLDDPVHTIFTSTQAIFFFGTPHRGLEIDDISAMVDHNSRPERAHLVESLSRNSKELRMQLQHFINLSPRFKIYSFYELSKTRKLRIEKGSGQWKRNGEYSQSVSDESAILGLPNSIELRIPVDYDHSNLVKFDSKQDPTYTSIVEHLSTLIEDRLLKELPISPLGSPSIGNHPDSRRNSEQITSSITPAWQPIASLELGAFQTHNDWRSITKGTNFSASLSSSRPMFAHEIITVTGLSMVDLGDGGMWPWNVRAFNDHCLRIHTYIENDSNGSFIVHINSWRNSYVYNTRLSWLKVSSQDPNLQCGNFNTLSMGPTGPNPPNEFRRTIKFHTPFPSPPQVFVGLSGFDMGGEWHLYLSATNIAPDQFTIVFETWGDTRLWSAGASWIAFAADRPDMVTGTFGGSRNIGWDGRGKFSRSLEQAPSVFTALTKIDVDNSRNLRVRLDTTADRTGIDFSIVPWEDTFLYEVCGAYLAVAL